MWVRMWMKDKDGDEAEDEDQHVEGDQYYNEDDGV